MCRESRGHPVALAVLEVPTGLAVPVVGAEGKDRVWCKEAAEQCFSAAVREAEEAVLVEEEAGVAGCFDNP
jgi:hypothetical protein